MQRISKDEALRHDMHDEIMAVETTLAHADEGFLLAQRDAWWSSVRSASHSAADLGRPQAL